MESYFYLLANFFVKIIIYPIDSGEKKEGKKLLPLYQNEFFETLITKNISKDFSKDEKIFEEIFRILKFFYCKRSELDSISGFAEINLLIKMNYSANFICNYEKNEKEQLDFLPALSLSSLLEEMSYEIYSSATYPKNSIISNNNSNNSHLNFPAFYRKIRTLQTSTCRVLNCNTCVSKLTNSCQVCNSGYYIVTSALNIRTCTKCPSSCAECSVGANSAIACTKCISDSYFLNNTACSSCPSNCKKCANVTGVCQECNTGYYKPQTIVPTTNTTTTTNNVTNTWNAKNYIACQVCLQNCNICTDSTTCSSCKDFYLLDASKKNCISCYGNSCQTCNTSGNCLACSQGYYLNENSKCAQCVINNCNSCNQYGACDSCQSGYYPSNDGNQCLKCSSFDANCINCSGENLCNSCTSTAYVETITQGLTTNRLCRKCDIGTYVKNENSCGLCTDFGKCKECTSSECSVCIDNASFDSYFSCSCNAGNISIGEACISIVVIIIPVSVVIIIIGVVFYIIIRRKNNILNGRVNIVNNNINNNNNNLVLNNQNNIRNNNINIRNANNGNNNANNQNQHHPRVALENRILKPLAQHDPLHGNKCIYNDESPPFWEFNCGGYMCNPCSLKFVTNFSSEKANCPKCSKPHEYFKFVNRFIDNEDVINMNNTSLIRIDQIKTDSLNNSLNESQNDSVCKICFVLKNSKTIKCESNTPHMLCSYCYNRLINIEETAHCPFCRSNIHA